MEVHAAHGYLINQFLSPYTNKRTDKYGGNFVNRMRFLTEIIVGVRYACPGFPISVRISADEFIEGGLKLEDSVKIARYLESIGVSAINVSCGTYESGYTVIEPYTLAEGWKKHLAAAVKKAVKIPVIAVNNIKHPAVAEQLLEEGVCDFVGHRPRPAGRRPVGQQGQIWPGGPAAQMPGLHALLQGRQHGQGYPVHG